MQAGPFGRGNKRPRPRAVEEEARPAAAASWRRLATGPDVDFRRQRPVNGAPLPNLQQS
jgi:hypothetical protein